MGSTEMERLNIITDKLDKLRKQHESVFQHLEDIKQGRQVAMWEIRKLNSKIIFWFRVASLSIASLLGTSILAAYFMWQHFCVK